MSGAPRIGIGIDLHRLEPGRPCRLGGVQLENELGPVGHSDGDAILHAACDACLGAAGLPDLGSLFSDRDPANAGRDSAQFCAEVLALLGRERLAVGSMDIVVEAEAPRIAPHRDAIRDNLARLFALPRERVNVKGKSGEGLGAIGAGRALRATVVVLLAPA